MPTPNQTASKRPISFVFHNLAEQTRPFVFPLVVRPEELTRSDTSRATIHQTLGGAWADSFGAGVPMINISGTTGWGQGGLPDGQEQFQGLFETVFRRWHEERASAILAGNDPDRVKLIFVDELNDFSGVVIPTQFTLKRSKSRPLLSQYAISLALINEDISETEAFLLEPIFNTGVESFLSSLSKIQVFLDWLKTSGGNIMGPLKTIVADFTQLTANVFGFFSDFVTGAKSVVTSITDPLMNIAGNLARAGANVMSTIRTLFSFPQQVDAIIARVESAYSNVACLISNVFKSAQFLQNYDDLYGASNCSSTAGGRPISIYDTENPFPVLLPISGTQQQYTNAANNAIGALAGSDVVLSPMDATTLSQYMSTVVGGFNGLAT